MRSKLCDLGELVGLILIAVSIGALFGLWWGVLLGAVMLVAFCGYTDALERRAAAVARGGEHRR